MCARITLYGLQSCESALFVGTSNRVPKHKIQTFSHVNYLTTLGCQSDLGGMGSVVKVGAPRAKSSTRRQVDELILVKV